MADAVEVSIRKPCTNELLVGPDQLAQLADVLEEEHVVGAGIAKLQEEVPWLVGSNVDIVVVGVIYQESGGRDVRQQRHITVSSCLKQSRFVALTRLSRVGRAKQRVHSVGSCLGGRGYHGKSQRRSRKT